MNDIKLLDTSKPLIFFNCDLETKKWETDDFIPFEKDGVLQEAPMRRMHHAAEVYGCVLAVHGGFSGETKKVLGDIALFDLSKLF